jgi:hypothetical protein
MPSISKTGRTRPRVSSTWSRDQAIANARSASAKAAAATRRRWQRFREAKCRSASSTVLDYNLDYVQEMDTRLARAARGGAAPATLDRLASALLKAKQAQGKAGKRARTKPDAVPMPVAVPVEQPTPTPAQSQPQAMPCSCSCPAPAPEPRPAPAPAPAAVPVPVTGKESLSTGTRGGGVGGGGSQGGAGVVGIAGFTARVKSGQMPDRVAGNSGSVTGSVAGEGPGPGAGMEKVKIGGIWVWARKG